VLYAKLQRLMPPALRRHVLHFDCAIEDAVLAFASSLAPDARVLDAGAGESRHRRHFGAQRYVALDLAVGDAQWNYAALDVLGDLGQLPLRDACCDAALNIVTLEHVRDPQGVLRELARVTRPGGRLLIAVPHEWEEHQTPHDYFRYTRYGLRHLLETGGA
jgi:ubiquinone/menaquinone biosynthesis C-methylase UbiE